jgi:hypothetical protein
MKINYLIKDQVTTEKVRSDRTIYQEKYYRKKKQQDDSLRTN